ncbi:serine/threonine protein kinase [Rhodoferax sp. 4810]|uniref:non-specific serine/threonine protein kinase n=2 Tax=Thiospirillum jenense TaxID=1653858 RepID=A0A839HK16_9GAMM|nr:serine/threonine protein kinase [Rhodoferax jenense]MBB1126859.1 serine/threonine protein kinase [Thiospirillum jenense]
MVAPTRDSLDPGTYIDCYRIVRTIGKGGFSLIYLAKDDETGDEAVIKEFMPKKIGRRDTNKCLQPIDENNRPNLIRSLRLFFQEAKAMAALRHPNIVQVRGLFLTNNTGYLVMQHERGRNLAQFVHERGGGLSTTLLLRIFLPLLDALMLIHSRGMLHLDIKPGNIHLRHGHDPLLLDLGAVQVMSSGRSLGGQVITAGYSPPEQYTVGGNIGPWTDVYAVGAAMRSCLDGKTPPPSPERVENDTMVPLATLLRDRYPQVLLEAIDWTMDLQPERRPQDAGEFLAMLHSQESALPKAALREFMPTRSAGLESSTLTTGLRMDTSTMS